MVVLILSPVVFLHPFSLKLVQEQTPGLKTKEGPRAPCWGRSPGDRGLHPCSMRIASVP